MLSNFKQALWAIFNRNILPWVVWEDKLFYMQLLIWRHQWIASGPWFLCITTYIIRISDVKNAYQLCHDEVKYCNIPRRKGLVLLIEEQTKVICLETIVGFCFRQTCRCEPAVPCTKLFLCLRLPLRLQSLNYSNECRSQQNNAFLKTSLIVSGYFHVRRPTKIL